MLDSRTAPLPNSMLSFVALLMRGADENVLSKRRRNLIARKQLIRDRWKVYKARRAS